ncbi:MAG: Zn-ribbon domain-containing OB-fold protein [Blastocatellia bacterium]
MTDRQAERLTPVKEVRGQISIPYRWSYGHWLTRFFDESREHKRLMGTRCPRCGAVVVPAARICTRCFVEATEWVEVSDHGVLATFTTVHLPFPGQPTEPPYTYGLILLDGASTYYSHLINEPGENLSCGMRVQAVWSDERKGDLFDILHFAKESE